MGGGKVIRLTVQELAKTNQSCTFLVGAANYIHLFKRKRLTNFKVQVIGAAIDAEKLKSADADSETPKSPRCKLYIQFGSDFHKRKISYCSAIC